MGESRGDKVRVWTDVPLQSLKSLHSNSFVATSTKVNYSHVTLLNGNAINKVM
jgi:hypothetical protein